MRTVAFPRVNRAGPRARQGRLHPRSGHGGRRKVVREGAGQAAVTGEGAGWRVRRRRLPGPRSPPGPEPAVRTLPGRGSRASRGRARRAAAGKEVGAAPRDARASFMNAPCRVGCQGTGRPTGIPGTVKTWPRGARGGPWHARAAVVARHPGHELSPGTCPAGVFLDNARVRRRAGRHGGLRDPRRPVVSAVATVREAPAVPADRVGSAAPMVAVPQQAANEAGLMSRMLVDPVVHDDCIAWTDADTARKGIALDEAARRADVLYLAECALKRDSAEGWPRRHRPRRAGRLSALQVHRQARRIPLPRLRAVPLLQPARQQRLRVLPCRAPRPHLRPPAGTPGKSGQVAQTNQATPERPRSGVFASERCQT